MSLANRHALVTGSTSGIGLAIARALAKEGADVMINGLGDKAAIEADRVAIEQEFGVKAFYHGADMANGAEIAALVAEHGLYDLDAPIRRVAGFDTIMPLFKLEHDYIPSMQRIVDAVELTCAA